MKLEGRESIKEDNFRYNTLLWRMRKGLSQRAISELLGYGGNSIISLHCFWFIVDHLDIDPWLLATGKTHKEG
ncbi:hypothetical protein [Acidaminococcus timonensis]|uniref:hypothetical protein n=1 Tax=Acidaminococcus timonensis TaxID=1871002 RepID=UPI0008DAC8ED|nr:hypothetical protein [Acidaminococcus timonensis]